jgi:hypothetical protein
MSPGTTSLTGVSRRVPSRSTVALTTTARFRRSAAREGGDTTSDEQQNHKGIPKMRQEFQDEGSFAMRVEDIRPVLSQACRGLRTAEPFSSNPLVFLQHSQGLLPVISCFIRAFP